jgi:putative colanic acid biosynthesis acetyltransferase WcaF
MAKGAQYNAAEHIPAEAAADPYLRPAFAANDRAKRLVWGLCWALLYRTSPRPMHAWRSFLLRSFGAKMGPDCHFYPASKVWAPWNLECAGPGDGWRMAQRFTTRLRCVFGSHAIVSQGAFVCGATHDYDDPRFPLLAYAMSFGAYSWVCARACVSPGVNVGEGRGAGAGVSGDARPGAVGGVCGSSGGEGEGAETTRGAEVSRFSSRGAGHATLRDLAEFVR